LRFGLLGYSVAKDRSRRSKRGSKASARADLLAKIKNAKATGQKYVPEVRHVISCECIAADR